MTDRVPILRQELNRARAETDQLFQYITPEALYERPIAERHRLVFYLGHLEAFDWNVLGRKASGKQSFHPVFDALFERGIDPEPGKAPSDTAKDWPKREEVEDYGARSRERIDQLVDHLNPSILQMIIEHRYMHAETFAYLLHNVPYEKKMNGPLQETTEAPPPSNPLVPVPAGPVTMGNDVEGFGWDNERPAHTVQVPSFRISKYKISNGEYLKFVQETGATPSHFWENDGHSWNYRGMFGAVPLSMNHPVWVTWMQAKAYADWRGLKLPSEAQYLKAASLGKPDARRDNFGSLRFDPIPVNSGTNGGSSPVQMVGNGWEWTGDLFAPFVGFEADPNYPQYSADFFDNQHYVMKGASPRTAALLTRPSFRNWFRPEYPHMYAGFRLVEE